MNRVELIDAVASQIGLSKKDTKAVFETVLTTIASTLAKGESVDIAGFGSFKTSARAARTAKVPGTDKTVNVPATTVAKFKVGKALKEAVAK